MTRWRHKALLRGAQRLSLALGPAPARAGPGTFTSTTSLSHLCRGDRPVYKRWACLVLSTQYIVHTFPVITQKLLYFETHIPQILFTSGRRCRVSLIWHLSKKFCVVKKNGIVIFSFRGKFFSVKEPKTKKFLKANQLEMMPKDQKKFLGQPICNQTKFLKFDR